MSWRERSWPWRGLTDGSGDGTRPVWRLDPQGSARRARGAGDRGAGLRRHLGGASPTGDLSPVPEVLAATERIVVTTGVVNMWATPAGGGRGGVPPARRRVPRPVPAGNRDRAPGVAGPVPQLL